MTKDYLQYYDLEKYLFNVVSLKFKKEGFLTAHDFFCIVIWKANRSKTKIKKRLINKSSEKDINQICKTLTKEIADQKEDKNKLAVLLYKWKFRLPMATAILTVLYPTKFTIYDVRVRGQLKIEDFSNRKNQIERYFSEYLVQVENQGVGHTLREKDKYFWGKSFAEDLEKLIQ